MKKFTRHIGLFLIIIGVLMLIATRIPPLGSDNRLLLCGLLAIVAGIVGHIQSIKHESNY